MHKYILIPDSFKGTLSARDFCAVAREAIGRADPGAQVLSIPLADGGEGTVEAFLAACGGQRIECPCTGPYGGTAPGFYGLLPDGTAVVELAAAAGLPLAGTDLHPAEATTYGVGQLLLHAARHGARRLLLGLGGSATNDGGCGAAAALGVEFYDRRGRTFVPTGGTLVDIHRISAENLEPLPPVTVLCDVDNPLCAAPGALPPCSAPRRGRTRTWCSCWTRAWPIWRRCCAGTRAGTCWTCPAAARQAASAQGRRPC